MTDTETHTPSTEVVAYREGMHSIEMAPAAWQLAHRLADTDFVPRSLRGKPGAVLACILTGHELGVEPMQALQKIHVIDGRPAMAAELMRALVIRHGHEIWFEEMSSQSVTIIGKRRDKDRITKVTWTMDDARKANLADKDNWRKYPMDMLAARSTGRLCRAIFPDVLAGLSYTLEELSDGEVVHDEDLGAVSRDIMTGNAPAPVTGGTSVKSRHRASKRTTAGAPAAETPSSPAGPRPSLPGEDDIVDAVLVDPDDDIIEAEIVEDDDTADDTERPPESPETVQGASLATDTPVTPDDDVSGPRYSAGQIVAMRFAAKGITDRDIRLTMSSELIGRTITSGNDIQPDEVHLILEALDEMPDAATVDDTGPAADPPPPDEVRSGPSGGDRPQGPPPEGWTGDQWRHFIQSRGVKASVTLKKARELSGASIPTLDDIAGNGIAEELIEFVEDAGT